MGKKHKKHKSEKRDYKAGLCEAAERTDKPLRLVLKVVGATVASLTTSSPAAPATASTTATTTTASSVTTAANTDAANTTATAATAHEPPVRPPPVSAAVTVAAVAKTGPSPSLGSTDGPQPEPDAEPDRNADSERHRERRKKKKKKSEKERERRPGDEERRRRKVEKKKHREKEQSGSDADEEFSPPKKVEVKAPPVPERPLRACRNKDQGQELTPLQLLLEHLLQQLQRRDPHGFFALPVTDMIAPGYSMIIKHPMDFSSMKDKIERNAYQSLTEFKGDFKLMCDNAMTYNRPETVYYKAARKLLHTGFKMMCKEKLLLLKRSMVFMHSMDRSQEAAIYGEGGCCSSSSPLLLLLPGGANSDHGSLSPAERTEAGRRARKSGRDALSFPAAAAAAYTPESSACSLAGSSTGGSTGGSSTGEEDVTALAEHAADEARERLQHGRPRSKLLFNAPYTDSVSVSVIGGVLSHSTLCTIPSCSLSLFSLCSHSSLWPGIYPDLSRSARVCPNLPGSAPGVCGCQIGFLRRDCGGSTSLAVVNPSDPDTEEEEMYPVNMGVLVGKIHPGIPVPPGFRDDRRGKLRPVTYLNYGPYSGQPPVPPPPPPPPYEGPLAGLLDGAASSSQLLCSTYGGDDAAVQYALSLQEFAKGCGECAARVVDDLLDALTSGEHSRTLRLLHEVTTPPQGIVGQRGVANLFF
ncbi:bromodomain-containing protein 9-like [Lampetra fluviatilis]